MGKFEIFTDSSCDLPKEMIERFRLNVMQLEVIINDIPPVLNDEVDIKDFYNQLRAGANAKTSAVTLGFFETHMRKCLSEGKDILYLGFSSGLSVTYNNGVMIIEELKKEFPERKILYTDTLCGSVGQGLLVYYAAVLKESGVEMEEILEKINEYKDRIHHQITVDDLFFLKRGGRISTTTAIAGSVLKFKPIIIMEKDGHLNNVGKVRGRKTSLKELFSRLKENEDLNTLKYVFISHADCEDDAKFLASLIEAEYEYVEVIISDIGPVIGAHTGPGGLALCYLGKTVKGM